jgi:hypothetical protein
MKLSSTNNIDRIAICIPCRDTVHSLFSYNLIQTVQFCNAAGIRVNVFMETGSLIPKQRQNLAEAAINSGATHIMWFDSDMMFPTNVIETLLSHKTDIVACNYSTRNHPFKGVAYTSIGDWNSWLGYNINGERLVDVEGVGMGCMLVKSNVYLNLNRPWFEISWNEQLNDHIGEDFYFCTKAREAGYSIKIDTHLSREIRHLGTSKFDLARTMK